MLLDEMQETITKVIQKIHVLPFNVELAEGTLASTKLEWLFWDSAYREEKMVYLENQPV